MRTSYAIGLGSNMWHARFGDPRRVIAAAIATLDLPVTAVSKVISSRPLGPSRRAYANAAAIIETRMTPPELLDHLKRLEAHFGRRRGGRRWSARPLDLDILLWSGGMWASPGLGIPHSHFRTRAFVLAPLCEVAPAWRDPLSGLCVRQLKARLDRRRPLP